MRALTVFAAALMGGAMILPAAAQMPDSGNMQSMPMPRAGASATANDESAATPSKADQAALRAVGGDTTKPFNAKTLKADNQKESDVTAQLNAKEAQMAGAGNGQTPDENGSPDENQPPSDENQSPGMNPSPNGNQPSDEDQSPGMNQPQSQSPEMNPSPDGNQPSDENQSPDMNQSPSGNPPQ